jgi:hypothetical protein
MGNANSRLKSKKQTKSFDQTLSLLDSNDNQKITYCSDNVSDTDRMHTNHFYLKYVFQDSFSSPVKDKLIQGCKTLDVG